MIISKNLSSVLSICLIISLFALGGCDSSERSKQGQRTPPAHRVAVETVQLKQLSHQQIASGSLEAITLVRLYSEETGRITQLPFFEGDPVKKGEIIITQDDSLIRAELKKATAQSEQAAIDLRRMKKLLPKNLTTADEVARARTALSIANAEKQRQQTRISHTTVKAPFDGVISERNNEPGDIVAPNTHILSMIDTSSLRIKLQLAARWIPLIQAGDEVQLSIDALGEGMHNGTINRIHPTIDPGTRKGIVEVVLDPVPENAKAGQLARVHIVTTPVNRLVVPAHAIHHDIDGAYVYRINQNEQDEPIAHKAIVEKGLNFGGWTEILSGINENNIVVTKGFLGLSDNKKVQLGELQPDVSQPDES